jgi:hypothetical protein
LVDAQKEPQIEGPAVPLESELTEDRTAMITDLFDEHPLEIDYFLGLDFFVMPLSLSETFDCFWADNATYPIMQPLEEQGHTITDSGKWTKQIESRFRTTYGEPTYLKRVTEIDFLLPPNPILDIGYFTSHNMLGEVSPTALII